MTTPQTQFKYPAGSADQQLFKWARDLIDTLRKGPTAIDPSALPALALSNLAAIAADTIVGNNTGSPAVPAALTEAQVTAMLVVFTNVLQGLVPASGGGTTNFLRADATWAAPPSSLPHVVTRQWLTSGTAATYTTPASCRAILVRAIAGGGGGGGTTGTGGTGGTTTFNSINAAGGTGGVGAGGAAGTGGTGGTGTASLRLAGGDGNPSNGTNSAGSAIVGGNGGSGPFGGAGKGAETAITGGAGKANTGGGGGGAGGSGGAGNPGGGGGAGEYFELYIVSPAATYTYTIAAGGTAGTGTVVGAVGGTGLIIVEEYY